MSRSPIWRHKLSDGWGLPMNPAMRSDGPCMDLTPIVLRPAEFHRVAARNLLPHAYLFRDRTPKGDASEREEFVKTGGPCRAFTNSQPAALSLPSCRPLNHQIWAGILAYVKELTRFPPPSWAPPSHAYGESWNLTSHTTEGFF